MSNRFWKDACDIEVPNDLLDLSSLPYLIFLSKKWDFLLIVEVKPLRGPARAFSLYFSNSYLSVVILRILFIRIVQPLRNPFVIVLLLEIIFLKDRQRVKSLLKR